MYLANVKNLTMWGSSTHRARYDYVTDDHVIEEVFSDGYFGAAARILRQGDLIYVRDAANEEATFRVDWVDVHAKQVCVTLSERQTYHPPVTVDNLTVAYKGPRNYNYYCVLSDGNIVFKGFRTKQAADQKLAEMRAGAAATQAAKATGGDAA